MTVIPGAQRTSDVPDISPVDRTDRFRVWADLAFHYSLTYDELRYMPRAMREMYEQELPRLLAEEQSRLLDVFTFTKMKPEAQRRVTRRLQRTIEERNAPRPTVELSKEDAVKHAAALGIQITEVAVGGDS
jgi:hypothetical protein